MPPLRLLLVLDNLSGHHTPSFVMWLCEQGIMPLYTALGGSWLTMSESIQRILKRRALDGEHPTTPPAVELTGASHFAVSALALNKGQGRDKWPTRVPV